MSVQHPIKKITIAPTDRDDLSGTLNTWRTIWGPIMSDGQPASRAAAIVNIGFGNERIARVYAAAPEMYELLKESKDHVANSNDFIMRDSIDALIAKIEGATT